MFLSIYDCYHNWLYRFGNNSLLRRSICNGISCKISKGKKSRDELSELNLAIPANVSASVFKLG